MAQEKPKKLSADEATRKVEGLFCRGLDSSDIVQRAKDEAWGLSDAALKKVIEEATDRLIEVATSLNFDTEVGKALTRLNGLFDEAKERKDTKSALAVQREINALLGLSERARGARRQPGKKAKLLKFTA